jgi:hypothetical protein
MNGFFMPISVVTLHLFYSLFIQLFNAIQNEKVPIHSIHFNLVWSHFYRLQQQQQTTISQR